VETGTLADMRHLTTVSVEAELSGPATLDGIPGVHELAVTGTVVRCRVDHAALDEVVGRLHQAGIRSLTCRPPTLEELFPSLFTGAVPGREPAMTGFAGTGQLSKLVFRRDAAALPACVFGIAALLAITARDLKVLYPTAASRLAVAREASANPALRFLLGRLNGTSVGAFLAARWSVWGAAFAVLLTIFIVVRHTRGDEEAGRLELVGSAAVGRQAPLTAALLAAAAANVAIALLTCLWLLVLKLPLAGSAALALSISGCGLVFGGVAAIGAQPAVTARGARGLAIAPLGAAFVLRAVGDTGPAGGSWLSWASPLGWVELTRAFGSAGERWWVLTLPLAASAVLVTAAFLLAAWRDHSAGLLPDRPGRATASGLLHGPFGLAWRLQRPVLAAWLAAFVFAFAALGAGARGIGSIIGGSTVLRQYLLRVGYQEPGRARPERGNRADPVGAQPYFRRGRRCVPAPRGGRAFDRSGLRRSHRVREHPGAEAARRRLGPAARDHGGSGGGRLAVRAAALGVHRTGVDRGSPGRGHRGVRRTAAVARLDDGHLAVHPDPQAARRNRVGGAAALALRRRADDQHSRPDRTAAPRPRRPGPFPPGRRGPRPDRRLREL
jgi:ABC-2 type transport system permease protein